MQFSILKPLFVAIIVAYFLSQGAAASEQAGDKHLSMTKIQHDLDLIKDAFERVHPGYDRYTSKVELSRAWRNIAEQANEKNGMTVAEFYLSVQSVLSQIRCGHTKAELPKALKQERQTTPSYLPARWHIIEDRGFIVSALPNSGLQSKDEILAIDGESLTKLIKKYAPLISIDGYTDFARTQALAFSSEFMGGGIEHFGALASSVSDIATLKIKRNGKELDVSVNRINFAQWRTFQDSVSPFYRNFKDEVSLKLIGDHAAILTVNTFVNYRQPVDAAALFNEYFVQLRKQGRSKLIIDLRTNGGGSTDAMLALMSFIIQKPMKASLGAEVKTIEYQDLLKYMTTWDQRALNPNKDWFNKDGQGRMMLKKEYDLASQVIHPQANHFKGDVILLSSHANSSGSTNIQALLSQLDNVTVVGEPTGGSAEGPTANVMFFLTLPNSGIVARLPAQRVYNNVAAFEKGMGVVPDINIVGSAQHWLNDEDKILDAAISLIK